MPFLLLIRYQLLVMLSWEHLCQATAEFKSVMNLPFRASQAAVLLCPASLPLFHLHPSALRLAPKEGLASCGQVWTKEAMVSLIMLRGTFSPSPTPFPP